MNSLWQINNWKAIILCYQIGFRNGLKMGERPSDREWKEIYLRHPEWVNYLGATELTSTEYVNEVASHGKKVLYIKEK